MTAITDIIGREVLDSRGNPTVEAEVLPLFFRKYFLARILGWIGSWYTEKFAFAITPVTNS